jgi:hypothetical protein
MKTMRNASHQDKRKAKPAWSGRQQKRWRTIYETTINEQIQKKNKKNKKKNNKNNINTKCTLKNFDSIFVCINKYKIFCKM